MDDRRWRTLLAGLIAVGLGVYDIWRFGREGGMGRELDEALILLGLALMARLNKDE
jgi:hypothetical protein